MRTNAASLVEVSVQGEVWPPRLARPHYQPTSEGKGTVGFGQAGICFTHRVGDPAFGWEVDHLEPGVSIRNPLDGPEHALHYLACLGNEATVTSGACAGAKGTLTGEHAHLLVDFPPQDIELLAIGDRIQIRAIGTGLQLLDHPGVLAHKISPALLEALRLETAPDGSLRVPVVNSIPPYLMGSGAELMSDYVDQDFMTGDRAHIAELGLDRLRLGDVVAVPDTNHTWGRGYREGAMTIGVIIHGDSAWTGHGPGVLDLLTTSEPGLITTVPDPEANIGVRLGLRTREEIQARQPGDHVSSYAVTG